MNKKIERLTKSIQVNKQKRDALDEEIKAKEAQLKKLKNAEILNYVNELTEKNGIDMERVFEAIHQQDVDALLDLMAGKGAQNEQSI